MTFLRALGLLTLSPLLLAACGGSTTSGSSGSNLDQDGGAGTGGSATGGASAGGAGGSSDGGTGGGGISGSGGVGNAGSGTGGELACCLAAAVCNEGDEQISGPDQCPADADCYSNSICCSTVWCIRRTFNCFAWPACDLGDQQLDGACPPLAYCYPRSSCGVTITCLDTASAADAGAAVDGGSCNPDAEYNRNYVSTDPQQCQVIDYACPANTTYFGNDCGCGCEQASSCPPSVDCMPGPGTQDPLCTQTGQCPYTIRAL